MKKLIFIFLFYFLLIYNSSLSSNDNLNNLKIGLLAPFSGDYENLGNSLLLSTQLALSEIGDNRIVIIPKDTGSDNKEKFENALKEIIDRGAKIIIGPPDSKYFNILEKYNDLIFISLSNKQPKIKNNIISIGISLESQLDAIENFILNQNKKKTVIMYPQNEYASFVENKIKNLKLKNYKLFKYNSDPKVLTGEIEKLTNYSQRKKNLEYRKKILEDKDDEDSERELKKLDQMYTLGKVNFDSIIIIDFGNSLKSVLASLAFTDVDDKEILFTTVNQWFDESIFYENSVKNLYYPSIDLKNFKQYNKSYFETFKLKPNEITILAYDAIGLIYYVWKKNNGIKSINDFLIKDKIKGKIGNFSFNNGVVFQKLEIYKTNKNKFTKF
tara:strand:- start:1685 stop:2839 length:1155 start_codon:yes stop_codon:yes gene_type:complete